MGLIDVLSRAAASRAHVLIAEVPGAFRERVALECAIDRLGWCAAESVADADVLAVVGDPGEAFAGVIDHGKRCDILDAIGLGAQTLSRDITGRVSGLGPAQRPGVSTETSGTSRT